MNKLFSVVALSALLASCSNGGLNPTAFGGRADVRATAASTSADASSASGAQNITFTSAQGSLGVTVQRALVSLPDASGAVEVNLPAVDVPSGFTCDAAAANATYFCGVQAGTLGERKVAVTYQSSNLFADFLAKNPGAQQAVVRFAGNVFNTSVGWTSNKLTFNLAATAAPGTDGTPAVPLAPPKVNLDVSRVTPTPSPVSGCTVAPSCYSDVLNVPVSVDDVKGGAKLQLLASWTVNGQPNRVLLPTVLTQAPYSFTVDTKQFPNNVNLELQVQATGSDKSTSASNTITLPIYNAAPLPLLNITNPGNAATVTGVVPVTVNISQLAGSEYTLQGDIALSLIDFTGKIVATRTIAGAAVNNDGTYTTSQGFNTTEYASDTYLLQAQITLKRGGSISTVTRQVTINTNNTNRVPPSLLILSPQQNNAGVVAVFKDSKNGYVTAQATDDTGLKFVEIRVYGLVDDDKTPSRYIVATGGSTDVVTSLPLNYNATPPLPDGNYTVRVIAQDADGNRTFQETPIRIARDPNGSPVTLAASAKNVFINTTVTLTTGGMPAGTRLEFFVRGPSSSTFTKFDETQVAAGQSSSVVDAGVGGEGNYTFFTQAIFPDGSIYLSNQQVVSAVKPPQ